MSQHLGSGSLECGVACHIDGLVFLAHFLYLEVGDWMECWGPAFIGAGLYT